MEKKLPKVFANRIEKELTNNSKVYYERGASGVDEEVKKPKQTGLTIQQKINKIFGSPQYVYKADVNITLKNGKISKRIIGRNKYQLITIDNELIKIDDIVDIEFSEN